ncbi:unnamed protein product [Rhizophagus irregularis]|nr:unnamed protein product [Rhizophagus irregularis]
MLSCGTEPTSNSWNLPAKIKLCTWQMSFITIVTERHSISTLAIEFMKERRGRAQQLVVVLERFSSGSYLTVRGSHVFRNSKTVKLQSEKAKDIEETENTYSDEGLNVSNDIFVEGPEYLEVWNKPSMLNMKKRKSRLQIKKHYALRDKTSGNVNNFELGEYDLSVNEYKES